MYVGNHRAIVMKGFPCISAGSADLFFLSFFLSATQHLNTKLLVWISHQLVRIFLKYMLIV